MRVGHLCPKCVDQMLKNGIEQNAIDSISILLENVRRETLGLSAIKFTCFDEEKSIVDNMKSFWSENSLEVNKYLKDIKRIPESKTSDNVKELNNRLELCEVLVITANHVEGNRVTRLLMQLS